MSGTKERFPFLPVDVDRLTSDELVEAMSTEEFGAYFLLLCKAWKSEPPCTIPNDDQTLSRWTRVDLKRWVKIRTRVLAPWRQCDDGRFIQKRLHAVYQDVMAKVNQKKQAGAKGGKAKAIKKTQETLKNDEENPSGARPVLEHRYDSASSETLAEAWRNASKDKDKDKDILPTEVNTPPNPLTGEPECVDSVPGKRVRRKHAESVPHGNPAITHRQIDGRSLHYDDDRLVWEADFIRAWNELEGVARHERMELDTHERRLLLERLGEWDWDYHAAWKRFPLWTLSGIRHSLVQFLEPGMLSRIINGVYLAPAGNPKTRMAEAETFFSGIDSAVAKIKGREDATIIESR